MVKSTTGGRYTNQQLVNSAVRGVACGAVGHLVQTMKIPAMGARGGGTFFFQKAH